MKLMVCVKPFIVKEALYFVISLQHILLNVILKLVVPKTVSGSLYLSLALF